jgi:hypothetical protein
VARTQEALCAEIDLELSWSERELPEHERTKHVHRLHPYLGKFVPQLVETLLARYVAAALAANADGFVAVLTNVRAALRPNAPIAIVVNDRRGLYPEILERAGLRLEERLLRHVNRRTGRRAGEYFEEILIARRAGR